MFLESMNCPFGVRAQATNAITRINDDDAHHAHVVVQERAHRERERGQRRKLDALEVEANRPAVSGTMYQTYQMNTPMVARMVTERA